MRAHTNLAHGVDTGDGAATGTDFNHLDNWDGDRHAAAFFEAVGTRNFEGFRGFRHLVFDQADLRRGTTHVIGQNMIDAVPGSNMSCEDRTTGRARLQQAHWELDSRVDADDAATGVDHEDRTGQAFFLQTADQAVQVGSNQRLDESVGTHGVEALELAHLRRHFRRNRDAKARFFRQQAIADLPLVSGIYV
ncbi:hypothetical protein D3C86_1502920 [compost metagenome]